jgi:hypothetical protein
MKTQLVTNVDFRVAMLPVAAGTTDTQVGPVLDTEGYDSVTFVMLLGTVTTAAVFTLQVADGTLANGGDLAVVTGGVALTDAGGASSGKLLVSEIYRPVKRYVQLQLKRTIANVVISGAVAILHHGKAVPVASPSTDTLEAILLPTGQ